jgi:hypothetical protein
MQRGDLTRIGKPLMIPPNKLKPGGESQEPASWKKEGKSVKTSNALSLQLVLVLALIIGHGFPPGVAGA